MQPLRLYNERAVGGAREQASCRDPTDADRFELRDGRAAREDKHIDRDLDLAHEPRDLLQIYETRGVDGVGARVAIRDESPDRVVEILNTTEVVLGPCGEHKRLGERVSRLGGNADPLDRELEVLDPMRSRVVVLQRAAGRPGGRELRDCLGDTPGIVRKAVLAVHVQRQIRGRRELGDVRHELVAGHVLVEPAERPREPGARRRERLEAERRKQPCGAHVPGVRHHEDFVACM